MSLFATNRKTKRKYRRHKKRARNEHRESQAYTSPRESEKIGHGYGSGSSVL
jgi:hypothetical protein